MKVRVTDKQTAAGKKLQKKLEELKKLQVRIGFQRGENTEEDQTDLVDIAVWNELGTSNGIPSRPFMRGSVDNNADVITAFLKSKFREFLTTDMTAEELLRQIGAFQTGLVQKEIVDGKFVPNAPSTIRKKKSDKPLIDTGHMRQSVHYVIKPKGDDGNE